jgi:beta-lactamase class A
VIIGQFFYPGDRLLPFTRLDGKRVSSMNEKEITQLLVDTYSNVPLSLKINGEAKQVTVSEKTAVAGVSPDNEKIFDGLTSYPWWQRLVPFSMLFIGALKNQAIVVELDDARFSDYAKARLADCKVAPKNASVTVKNSEAALNSAKNGQQCVEKDIRQAILTTKLSEKGVTRTVKAQTVKPARSDKDVVGLLKDANELVNRKLSLKLADKEYDVDKATIASWLAFKEDSKDEKKLTIDVNMDALRSYVTEMQKKIYIAPTPDVVYVTDGVETSRTEGKAGKGLNHTETATALKEQLLEGDGVAEATIISLAPAVTYSRSYSGTKTGLQALLNDLVKAKGNYGISVRLPDGTLVSARGDAAYHPASTYKLYVAYSLLKRIESGEMNWDATATGGKSISQCFDLMIVNSDNTCAEWFGNTIGWNTITSEVRALGLSSTDVGFGTKSSTANDETKFLVQLQNCSFLQRAECDRLLGVMKRQVYRSGIPAGVNVSVADKVGFLDGLLHDSGIVYGSNKTYALSIMTNGSTWGGIADAAKQINALIARM